MTLPIRGAALPFRIDPTSGGVVMASDRDKLAMNLRAILATRLGERPLLRSFGSNAHALLQEANDPALGRLLTKQIQEALLSWERRVIVIDSRITQDREAGELQLELRYRYVDTPVEEELAIPLA